MKKCPVCNINIHRNSANCRKHINKEKKSLLQSIARKKFKEINGFINSPETRKKIALSNTGKKLSEESRRKMSVVRKGRKLSPQTIQNMILGRKKVNPDVHKQTSIRMMGHTVSQEVRDKISRSHIGKVIPPEVRMKMGSKGSKNPGWKGGIMKAHSLMRNTCEYRLWRESVFKRDKFTCVWCSKIGGSLNADHIKPFAYYPELRFAIDNGRTLCVECHKKTDTYLYKARNHKPI